jgi:hypothetical protein
MGRTKPSRPTVWESISDLQFPTADWSVREFENRQSKIGTWQLLEQLDRFGLPHRRNLLKLAQHIIWNAPIHVDDGDRFTRL